MVHEVKLDEKVRLITMSLRTKYTGIDATKARFFETDQYQLGSHLYKRLRIILRSNGCSVPTCTMCPFPNEALDPTVKHINAEEYIQQVKNVLTVNPSFDILSIYNDGSFFAGRELPQQARQEIYQIVKDSGCQYLMVESLPFFITKEKLQEAKNYLGNKVKLIVGMGLQSVSDIARYVCIRTPITKEDFLQAHNLLKQFNYDTKAYIILKPPFFLEEESINDAVDGAVWLSQHDVQDITLCPMRIAQGTVLQDLFDRKLYTLPTLASFTESLYKLQQKNIRVRISIFNVNSSDLDALTPSGCLQCEVKILRGLENYNNLIEVDFSELRCPSCLQNGIKNDPTAFKGRSFEDRVKIWIHHYENKTAQINQDYQQDRDKENSQDNLILNVQTW